jgi:hypothetical protein
MRKSSGVAATISDICTTLPEASFTATMVGMAARRATVFGSMFTPVRPGTL